MYVQTCVCVHVLLETESRVSRMPSMYSAMKIDPLAPQNVFLLLLHPEGDGYVPVGGGYVRCPVPC